MTSHRHRLTKAELDNISSFLTDPKFLDSFKASPAMKTYYKKNWTLYRIGPDGSLMKGQKRVIPMEDYTTVLQELYSEPQTFATGRDSFYSHVKKRFANIPREAVIDFLRGQRTYQLNVPVRKQRDIKPLIVTKPGKYLQCDLIDMSSLSRTNSGIKFVLTVIDCHSKYLWAVPLKYKTAEAVAAALEPIIDKHTPKVLHSDNGTEFKGAVDIMLKEKNVRHILGPTYRPQAQGTVERVNGTLKRMVMAWMTKQQSKRYIDDLPALVTSYNNMVHSTTGVTPTSAMKGKHARDISQRIRSKVEGKIEADARAFPELVAGDKVRVAREVYDSEYRKAKLVGTGKMAKGTAAKWSTKVYVIKKKVNTKPPSYELTTSEGRFRRDQLQKII